MSLRNIDQNLLVPLQALLEERNVTRAGKRVNLTQSAMSRALERLREILGDDLLIRARRGYELTPRATMLARELELLLPRLEHLWSGETFVPASMQGRIRIAMTDYVSTVVLPRLMPELRRLAPGVSLEIAYWHDRAFDDLTAGTVDLVFSPLATPSVFHVQQLFEDKFVCLVGRNHPFRRRSMAVDVYLKSEHVSVETQPRQQNLIDRSLAEAGLRRRVVLHLPYIVTSVLALEGTHLVLTTPSRVAKEVLGRYEIRQVMAPSLLPPIQYSMVWHPRLEREELHAWFRSLVRTVCGERSKRERMKVGLTRGRGPISVTDYTREL